MSIIAILPSIPCYQYYINRPMCW